MGNPKKLSLQLDISKARSSRPQLSLASAVPRTPMTAVGYVTPFTPITARALAPMLSPVSATSEKSSSTSSPEDSVTSIVGGILKKNGSRKNSLRVGFAEEPPVVWPITPFERQWFVPKSKEDRRWGPQDPDADDE